VDGFGARNVGCGVFAAGFAGSRLAFHGIRKSPLVRVGVFAWLGFRVSVGEDPAWSTFLPDVPA
jgi:hypothetical protein